MHFADRRKLFESFGAACAAYRQGLKHAA